MSRSEWASAFVIALLLVGGWLYFLPALKLDVRAVVGRWQVEELIVSTFRQHADYAAAEAAVEKICSSPVERSGIYYACTLQTGTYVRGGKLARLTETVTLYAFATRQEAEKMNGKTLLSSRFVLTKSF